MQLCLACRQGLPRLGQDICPRCGHYSGQQGGGCPLCHGSDAPDVFYCAYLYETAMMKLIHQFKYQDRPWLAGMLADLIWISLADSLQWEEPDLILPVPLHPWKLIARRYNQSALLAGEVAKRLHRPLVTNRLFRIRMTPSQSRLDRAARQVNLKDAFRAQQVAGKAVLLVDDVMTTGATLREATRALKQAEAKRVALLCLARTTPEHHWQQT
ncbi:MAG: ComF family protein [Magnetococcales bacterium]|nr:ComF family protein [Magnetococcales bacterium]NGZ28143.1 ComF family protein [Magnetococcales bacterium]